MVVGYKISRQPIGTIFKGQSIPEVHGIWFIYWEHITITSDMGKNVAWPQVVNLLKPTVYLLHQQV